MASLKKSGEQKTMITVVLVVVVVVVVRGRVRTHIFGTTAGASSKGQPGSPTGPNTAVAFLFLVLVVVGWLVGR